MSDLRGGSMTVFMVFDSPKGRIYRFMMEHPHDTLVPGISVQRLLTILLGEESAESIWGLVEQWGDKGERAVMPLIEEIVKGRQEIQKCELPTFAVSFLVKIESGMWIRIRGNYFRIRERCWNDFRSRSRTSPNASAGVRSHDFCLRRRMSRTFPPR